MTQFEKLYRAYFTDVYLYLKSLCGDETLAEELCSETFFRAMRGLKNFRGDSSVLVWLCQIGKNCYYTYLKKQKKQKKQAGPLPDELPVLPLRRMKKRLRRNIVLVVIANVAVMAVIVGGVGLLNRPHRVTYCADYFTVTENGDGSVTLTVDAPGVVAVEGEPMLPETGGSVDFVLGQEEIPENQSLHLDGSVWQIDVWVRPLTALWRCLGSGTGYDRCELTLDAFNGEPMYVYLKLPGYSTAGTYDGYALLYGEP